MKRVVLVAGVVYPQPTPPGKIALLFADILKEEFYVSIVFMQTTLKETNGRKIDGIEYFSVFGLRLFLETFFKIRSEKAKNKYAKKLLGLLILSMKAIGRVQSMVLFPNNLRWHYLKSYRKLLRLDKDQEIDIVFSVCSPFSAHLAGKKFKKKSPNIKWITYTVDPFAISERLNNIALFKYCKNKKNLQIEKQVYKEADFNLVSEEVYENDAKIFSGMEYKTTQLPYVLVKATGKENGFFRKNKLNLLYAGRFYRDIRNPEFLLRSFLGIRNENFLLHLFSTSDCEELIDKYIEQSEGRIIKHSPVSSSEVSNYLISADILINVGNSVPEFKPSKTFEYISTGKPIVNFFRNNLLDEELNHYPLCVQVNEDSLSIAESSQLIESFCIANKGLVIEWTELEKRYEKNTQENIKKILFSVIHHG